MERPTLLISTRQPNNRMLNSANNAKGYYKKAHRFLVMTGSSKIAGIFTNAEIVEKANKGREKPVVSSRLISERLWKATKFVAERDGKTREKVRASLDAVRKLNSVTDRKSSHAKAMRAASQAEEKAGHQFAESDHMYVDEDGAQQEIEMDDEDPLGDLEEMGRRVIDGTLEDDDEGGDDPEPEPVLRPKPFDGRPVGYGVGTDYYIPGFRTY